MGDKVFQRLEQKIDEIAARQEELIRVLNKLVLAKHGTGERLYDKKVKKEPKPKLHFPTLKQALKDPIAGSVWLLDYLTDFKAVLKGDNPPQDRSVGSNLSRVVRPIEQHLTGKTGRTNIGSSVLTFLDSVRKTGKGTLPVPLKRNNRSEVIGILILSIGPKGRPSMVLETKDEDVLSRWKGNSVAAADRYQMELGELGLKVNARGDFSQPKGSRSTEERAETLATPAPQDEHAGCDLGTPDEDTIARHFSHGSAEYYLVEKRPFMSWSTSEIGNMMIDDETLSDQSKTKHIESICSKLCLKNAENHFVVWRGPHGDVRRPSYVQEQLQPIWKEVLRKGLSRRSQFVVQEPLQPADQATG